MAIHGTIEQHHLDAILANSRVRSRLGFNSSTTPIHTLAQARTALSNLDDLQLNSCGLTSTDLTAMFSWVTAVDDDFYLYSNDLTNLDGLSSLTSVGGRFLISGNSLTDVTGIAWETLNLSYFSFGGALADDADVASVLAPMVGSKVPRLILRTALDAYPDYVLRAKPDNYIQEDEPTDVNEGDLWFNPSTCELKIFTEDS